MEECLHGTSVVHPLIPDETSDRAISAPDPVTEAVITPDDAPAVDLQEAISCPLPEAVSSPERVGHKPPHDESTPASYLSSGTVFSLESSPDVFALLTAPPPAIADSTESASRSASDPPDVEPFSDPAGQDRVRELMLELPTLHLE